MSDRPRSRVGQWVDHMVDCDRCRRYNTKLGRYEATTRAALCSLGVLLMDAWLDEGMVTAPRVPSHTQTHDAPVNFQARSR